MVDMIGGMLPAILPKVRTDFQLSLTIAVLVPVVMMIAANSIQMFTGNLRANRVKPLFLHLGLVLTVAVCLLGALPRSHAAIPMMVLLAIITGCGIGTVHPESLRAIHALPHIPPAISTGVFMTGGILGYASGGAISTILVSYWGLGGLYPLLLCPVLVIPIVVLLKIRLAVELKPTDPTGPAPTPKYPAFALVMIMALPSAISTTLIAVLLPTRLEELGFTLTFGGYSTTMFGLGGALGSLFWAAVAHRKGELLCSTLTFLLATPFALAYLLLLENSGVVWLIFAAGFFAFAGYILLITLARYAPGAKLGLKMGWIVGGTWLFANFVVFPLTPIAQYFGTQTVMQYAPLGYLLSGLIGIHLLRKTRPKTASNRALSITSVTEYL